MWGGTGAGQGRPVIRPVWASLLAIRGGAHAGQSLALVYNRAGFRTYCHAVPQFSGSRGTQTSNADFFGRYLQVPSGMYLHPGSGHVWAPRFNPSAIGQGQSLTFPTVTPHASPIGPPQSNEGPPSNCLSKLPSCASLSHSSIFKQPYFQICPASLFNPGTFRIWHPN